MFREVIGLIFCLGFSLLSSTVLSQESARTSFDLSALLGGNFCVPNGDADCGNIDPRFGFSFGGAFRIGPYFGLGADAYLGLYDSPGIDFNHSTFSLGFIVGPKGYLSLGPIDLFGQLGLGWGYTQLIEPEGCAFRELSLSGAVGAFALGVEYRVEQRLGVGLIFRYHQPFLYKEVKFYLPEPGKIPECPDFRNRVDLIHEAMAGISLTLHL